MRAAALCALGLGLGSALAGVAVAILAFEPIPFADFVDFFRRFFEVGGWDGYGPAELYARHNEHRLVVPRLWFLADVALFDGTQGFLIVVIVLSSALHAAVLAGLFRSLGHGGAMLWGFAALALGATLSPAQWENLVWGFQVQFIQVWLFATLAFVAVAGDATARPWRGVSLGILAALAATYSMANGLLVWPLLVFLALWCGVRGAPLILLAAAALAVVAIEVAGFRAHPGHGNPFETLAQPIALARYALRYLTSGIGMIGTLGQELVGAALVGTVVATAIDALIRRQRYRPAHAVLLAVAGFVIGAALVTALGRVTFGIGQANSVRYTTPSFVFLIAVAALLLDRAARLHRRHAAPMALAAAAVLLVVPGVVDGFRHRAVILAARDARANAVIAYLAGGYRPETLVAIYPFRIAMPFEVLRKLEAARLGPFAPSVTLAPPPALLAGPVAVPGETCRGNIDAVNSDPVLGLVASGWAAAPAGSAQPAWILLVDAAGAVVGWGASRTARGDVGKALGIGWRGRGFDAHGHDQVDGPVRVVGVFADGGTCRLGEPTLPAPPRFVDAMPVGALPATDSTWTVTDGANLDRLGNAAPPAEVGPAIGTLGLGSRLVAHLHIVSDTGNATLAVPVRTGAFPIGVAIVLRDVATGAELDRHDFTRPGDRRWTWLRLPVASEAARRLRLEVTAVGRDAANGIAVGRPRWISAGEGG